MRQAGRFRRRDARLLTHLREREIVVVASHGEERHRRCADWFVSDHAQAEHVLVEPQRAIQIADFEYDVTQGLNLHARLGARCVGAALWRQSAGRSSCTR